MQPTTLEPSGLTNEELLSHVKNLARLERAHLVDLLCHLGELDVRQAYLADGAPSLFRWCTGILHLSEAAAFTRIRAARAGRRFPLVLERVRSNDIHLSAIARLSPHLTPESHRALLDEARHASREAIDLIVARFMAPSVSSTRLVVQAVAVPEPRRRERPETPVTLEFFNSSRSETGSCPNGAAPDSAATNGSSPEVSPSPASSPSLTNHPETAWRLHMTLSAAAHNDLQRLQELMRHQVPDGDPALIVARALALLREQVEKRRLGLRRNSVRKRSHAVRLEAARVIGKNPCSRYIPAAIRHEVAARDLQQCAFVTADGRRCGERNWLEFHHIVPHARGGRAIAGNLELRCRAHNRYEAEREFDGSVREGAGRYEASGWNQAGRADFVDTGANRNQRGAAGRARFQRGGAGVAGAGAVSPGTSSTARATFRRYGNPSG